MLIKSDDKKIEQKLAMLEKALTDNGSWFHKYLSITCANKSISVEMAGPCNPMNNIIKIPAELLVRVENFNVSVKGNKFFIKPDKDKLTPAQIEIGKLVFDLYNLAGRVDFYKSESIWVTFREAPALMKELLKARTVYAKGNARTSFLYNKSDAVTMEEFVAADFLQTRVLGYKGEKDEVPTQVVMPIVDYMDHDHQASPFVINETEGYSGKVLKVHNTQPFTAKRQCLVSYGNYDALDTFVNYGFICETAPFVRSIPLDIHIRDTAGIKLTSVPAKPVAEIHQQLSDLKRFMPKVGENKKTGQLMVSHLIIPLSPTPHAMRRILRTIIRTLAGSEVSQKFVLDRTREAEQFILEKNIEFYNDLLKKVQKDKKTPDHLKQQIEHVAMTQINKLHKYVYYDDFFIPTEQNAVEQAEDIKLLNPKKKPVSKKTSSKKPAPKKKTSKKPTSKKTSPKKPKDKIKKSIKSKAA